VVRGRSPSERAAALRRTAASAGGPPGAKLSTEQLRSFKAGELYVNVHSEANKGGEIRAQLAP
jgi:CHRD domain